MLVSQCDAPEFARLITLEPTLIEVVVGEPINRPDAITVAVRGTLNIFVCINGQVFVNVFPEPE